MPSYPGAFSLMEGDSSWAKEFREKKLSGKQGALGGYWGRLGTCQQIPELDHGGIFSLDINQKFRWPFPRHARVPANNQGHGRVDLSSLWIVSSITTSFFFPPVEPSDSASQSHRVAD